MYKVCRIDIVFPLPLSVQFPSNPAIYYQSQIVTRGTDYRNGISIGLLSMIESGERPVTLGVCFKISTILSIDLETAMAAAYRDRVEFSAERERASIEAFFKTKKALRNLDPNMLTQRPEWQAGD